MSGRKLVVGCGYLGERVAHRWRQAGAEVFAVTRSPEKAERLSRAGLCPLIADITSPPDDWRLPPVDTILFALGHDRASALSIQQTYVGGMKNLLSAADDSTRRVIYISSTGVYSQNDGEWVTEASTCQPARAGGQACLLAEALLRSGRLGRRSVILRMAGLYGPGRIPRAADLLAGRPIDAPAHGWLNLIHVDDAAEAVLAAETKGAGGAVYLVSDGQPAVRRDYYVELARLLGAPSPVFSAPAPDSPAAARATTDKRIDNSRMVRELEVKLAYPSFREGLAAIVADSVGNALRGVPRGAREP
jgi:nucleoside-diphosphate-sugar epimerase